MTGIAVADVSHTYAAGTERAVPVLRSVTWCFPAATSTALLGRSGAGKSTLLAVLGLLLAPTAGECIVAGRRCSSLRERDRAGIRNSTIGFVFQRSHLAPALPVWKNVAMPATFSGRRRSRSVVHDRVEEVLAAVGLEGLGDRRPGELSGGQRQRVAVARALVLDPSIVLADEPTGALDERTGDLVLGVLLDACRDRGVTLVLATHDRRVAERCDVRVEVADGRVSEVSGSRGGP